MTDLHKRVSRRIQNFLSNGKSADRVAAEVLQMAGEHHAASVDTHPKDGDVKQAPLVSGAVGNAETPNTSSASITIARRGK